MRQWLRSHLTYANVMVTILAFIVLTGGTAVALSGSNTVFTDDIANDTQPASGGNPAGGLVAADLRPNSVGSSEAANNSLTGADVLESSLTGDVQMLVFTNAFLGSGPHKIATVGPYEIDGECAGPNATVKIEALGPAGTVDAMFDVTRNDNTDEGTQSRGLLIPANTRTEFASIGDSGENYRRIAGTAMLKSGSVLVQVEFNAVADDRDTGSCFIYGTATRAT
jgi:hypothetical protein